MLVLDSGAVSHLAQRSRRAAALIRELHALGQWPPVVPTMVVLEALQGRPGHDANANRLLKACVVDDVVPEPLARRAAELRRRAGRGSAVDALVVALAEPGGVVLTGDTEDLASLATHARGVDIAAV